jgi:hypothetical protein
MSQTYQPNRMTTKELIKEINEIYNIFNIDGLTQKQLAGVLTELRAGRQPVIPAPLPAAAPVPAPVLPLVSVFGPVGAVPASYNNNLMVSQAASNNNLMVPPAKSAPSPLAASSPLPPSALPPSSPSALPPLPPAASPPTPPAGLISPDADRLNPHPHNQLLY